MPWLHRLFYDFVVTVFSIYTTVSVIWFEWNDDKAAEQLNEKRRIRRPAIKMPSGKNDGV